MEMSNGQRLLVRLRLVLVLMIVVGFGTTTVVGEVFPNYHAHFDFVSWDKGRTVEKMAAEQKWWQTASFYQIYPRSFKDTNGDGVGDLRGISEKLPYLKEIGVTATWLSPIFTSPMADFGYDVANFTEIAPIFGTMQDFEAMLKKAQAVGVKIILDFVPNHSSDECEWFKKSAARDPYYKDFYVWHPGKVVNNKREPPSNWVSVFRGSAWEWHEGRQEYYLHQFVKKQPDLNYRNPKVRETMNEVLRFWLKKGVAGFRIDAVPHVFEKEHNVAGDYADEPRNNGNSDPDDYGYLQHIYTVDQPETLDLVYEWRAVLDKFEAENGGDDRILMAETYSPLEIVMKYYGNGTVDGAEIPFNFLPITMLSNDSNAFKYTDVINKWLKNMPEGRTANWVIGNHDQRRVSHRLGTDRVDSMNILMQSLPGCSITYYGEEIGMTDVWISWNDTVDPAACNANPSTYERFSRDPERTPFQWNLSENAGFSSATKTWLPVAANYKELNVQRQRGIPYSPLNVYKALKDLRKEATMRFGNTEVKAVTWDVLGIKRTLLNDRTYVIVLNIFDTVQTVDLTTAFAEMPNELEYVIVTSRSKAKPGDRTATKSVPLMAKEAVVLRSVTNLTTTVGYYAYYKPEVIH